MPKISSEIGVVVDLFPYMIRELFTTYLIVYINNTRCNIRKCTVDTTEERKW